MLSSVRHPHFFSMPIAKRGMNNPIPQEAARRRRRLLELILKTLAQDGQTYLIGFQIFQDSQYEYFLPHFGHFIMIPLCVSSF
jgi:hypothetical protein